MLRTFAFIVMSAGAVLAAQQPGTLAPARDTPGQTTAAQQLSTGKLSGRVVAADTGRPIPRARVLLSASQFPTRAVLTDEAGLFALTTLPEGRFTLTASKAGFVTLSYGQRRPLQAGTPIQLAAGQEIKGVEFRLPRGSVITGRVVDENGEPMPGTSVRVLAYQYAQGSRQLIPVGGAQTDDRGEYRVWGLNPGDYYVSANAQNFNPAPVGPPIPVNSAAGRGAPVGPGGPLPGGDDPTEQGYAPTYFPGVASIAEARPVTIGLSAEVGEINFNVLLVRTSRITGHVANTDGTPASGGNVTLTAGAPGAGGRGGQMGNYSGRIQADGRFTIANVPPGRYTLRARGNGRSPAFALGPLVLSGGDVSDVMLTLQPGASITGTITLQNTQSASQPDVSQFRITTFSEEPATVGPAGSARVDRTGAFTLDGVAPGEQLLRAQTPRGWQLKSVTIDGRESVDTPFEIRPGQKLAGVNVVFTDKIAEIDGLVTDSQGAPATEYTVLAFPEDVSLWRPQSRQIMTSRPDQNGRFQLRGLPPGSYYVAIIDPAVQGEWFDPGFLEEQRQMAQRVILAEGDIKQQNFSVSR